MSKIEVDAIDKQSGSTLTLGGSGTAVTLACGATQTGFGRTGTVDWNTTPKTATFTAVSGDGFFANTTGSAFNMNLPAGVAGAIVSVADYAGTWQTNNLTVVPNGTDKIGSVNTSVTLDTEGQSVTFVFVDSTQGWINTMDSTSNVRSNAFVVATGGTITTSGNDKIHTFTGPGTFTVSKIGGIAANNEVSYVVVAGGGGGGGAITTSAGAGGAGGYRETKSPVTPYTASPLDGQPSAPNRVTVTAAAFPITVGGGGTAGQGVTPGNGTPGGIGSNSVFSTITAAGGGTGGREVCAGGNGGSGGGGGGIGTGAPAGGSGNTPPTTPAQGTNGGTGGANPKQGGGAGGGATVAGSAGSGSAGGAGGAGATSSINATPTARAGGGGGSVFCGGTPDVGAGGAGGGGAGGYNVPGVSGTDNTGGGGGAAGGTGPSLKNGGVGGSGIVIIRYKFQ